MLCALIMAGGRGTRFWPLSTDERPKQFLNLIGEKTMIQMTVERIGSLIPLDRIFVCTGERYIDIVKEQLPDLPERNIIAEPEGRNTAPCILLSTLIINRYYENSTIVVLPSDYLIRDEKNFLQVLKTANEFINDYTNSIVTLGMKPDRPEIGYGYINQSETKIKTIEFDVIKVNKFVEKPNLKKALEYLNCGKYFWNGGMFVWKSFNIIKLFEKYMASTYEALKDISSIGENEIKNLIDKNYSKTEAISIDYGIMEKADNIYVIPCDFGWDDVGNWTSVERYSQKDRDGNVFKSEGYAYNSANNIILTNKKIILNNIEDLIIVETNDYIMISSKENEQDIKIARECIGN